MRAIDVSIQGKDEPNRQTQDVYYIRLSGEVLNFIDRLDRKHGVIGFEFDLDTDSEVLGVIVSGRNYEQSV